MAKQTDSDVAVQEPVSISTKTTEESQPFIGQWNNLVSTTNWDKGEIICQWRDSLVESDAKATQFTDEAWSQLVGGVTPQHVGRLRRTYEKFGHVFREYEGIYWSHFYAALDWDDAEMWLEGGVQNKWSVSEMRRQRWETLGKVGDPPQEGEVITTEVAEETQSLSLSENTRSNDRDYIEGPVHEGPDWGDESSSGKSSKDSSDSNEESDPGQSKKTERPKARAFESFVDMPDDVMEAANAFKVSIISHKSDEWEAVKLNDMLDLLDSLKQLAVAEATS
jgi:hypothetical protein